MTEGYGSGKTLFGGLLGVPETAELLAVSDSTVRRLIRRGALPAVRVGAQLKVARADLVAFVLEQREPVA